MTKTFTITASPEIMQRLENFLCFLHYNDGHSGLFGMPFDGDGSDKLTCLPPPIQIGKGHHHIASAGLELEVAYDNAFKAFALDRRRNHYEAKDGMLTRVSPNGERIVVKP